MILVPKKYSSRPCSSHNSAPQGGGGEGGGRGEKGREGGEGGGRGEKGREGGEGEGGGRRGGRGGTHIYSIKSSYQKSEFQSCGLMSIYN